MKISFGNCDLHVYISSDGEIDTDESPLENMTIKQLIEQIFHIINKKMITMHS